MTAAETMMAKFSYKTCCVESDADSINEMMDRAREIKFATLIRHVGRDELASVFPGYGRGSLKIENDYHVRYYSSRYQGRRCYVVRHSAIEYIFTRDSYRANDGARHHDA